MKRILFTKTIKKFCSEVCDKAFTTDTFWKTFVVRWLSLNIDREHKMQWNAKVEEKVSRTGMTELETYYRFNLI